MVGHDVARRAAATTLLGLGGLLIVVALGLLGRAYLGEWLHAQERPAAREALPAHLDDAAPAAVPPVRASGSAASPTRVAPSVVAGPAPTLVPAPSPEPRPEPGDASAEPAAAPAEAGPAVPAPARPEPTGATGPGSADPTRSPGYGRPLRIAIPGIELDAPVTAVGIADGVYEVPWWDVGWHEDSSPPGAPGNTIFNGHLRTIDAGRVFARLHELRPGDLVYVYSPGYRTAWAVESSERVPGSEHGFVGPTDDVRLTLYTCEGTFDLRTRTYSHYRVVVARFVEATPLEP